MKQSKWKSQQRIYQQRISKNKSKDESKLKKKFIVKNNK